MEISLKPAKNSLLSKISLYDVICILIGAVLIIYHVDIISSVDTDFFFLSATGDEIIKQGKIININPFFVAKGKPLVVQQWLWCVLCSAIKPYGNWGITAIQTAQAVIVWLLVFNLLKHKKITKYENKYVNSLRTPQLFMLTSIAIWGMYGFAVSIRPECITVILLLLQITATENYLQSKKKAWLCLLPVCTLIEINVHASLWFMHYCVLIPYFLPLWKSKARTSVKSFIAPMVAMTASLFINPLGYKAIVFVFEAVKMNTFNIAHSSEMDSFLSSSLSHLLFALFAIDKFIFCARKKLLTSEEFYISCGLIILLVMQMRNAMFVPVLSFYFLPHLFYAMTPDIKVEKAKEFFIAKKNILLSVVLTGVIIWLGWACINVNPTPLKTDIFDKKILSTGLDEHMKMLDYIENEKGINAKVMTCFNSGGLFEAKGFRNCYIDARPESFAFPNTSALGDTSILDEYAKLNFNCGEIGNNQLLYMLGITSREEVDFSYFSDEKKEEYLQKAIEQKKTYTDKTVKQILEQYRFDYYILPTGSRLYYYMTTHEGYKIIFETEEIYGYVFALIKDETL